MEQQLFRFVKTYLHHETLRTSENFRDDFRQFISDNNIFTGDLKEENFIKNTYDSPMGITVVVEFKGRTRNQDDDLRESIEFQIKNLQLI